MIRRTAARFRKVLSATFSAPVEDMPVVNETAGKAPGSAIFVGEKKLDKVIAQIITYSEETYEIKEITDVFQAIEEADPTKKIWINIAGLHDITLFQKMQDRLGFDPLMVEDILDTHQRPKFEQFTDHTLIAGKMLNPGRDPASFTNEQLSVVFNEHILFTFQEAEEDVFNPLRDRLQRANGRIRKRNLDYLAYALLDSLVDYYIIVIEGFGDGIDKIDTELLTGRAEKRTIEQITYYKREINYLRKVIRPFREAVMQLEKSDVIAENNSSFLKDLIDHTNQAIESIELYRELISDQMNLFHSNSANKLNDIMRILTIISVIFIPMTFIAGVYGMNFKYFPELDNPYAYPIFWTVEIGLAFVMLFLFRRKRWI